MLKSGKAAAAVMAGAALTAGVTTAALAAAAASPAQHTIRLTAVQLKSSQIGNSFVQAEKDLQRGKVTGYDTVTCVFNTKTHKAGCDAAVARANGLIYAHVVVAQTGTGSGKITGGTRAFKGATGTVTVSPGSAKNRTKIVIKYMG